MKSVREVLAYANLIDPNTTLWWFALLFIIFYSPLAWVRKLHVFSVGYIIGSAMIFFTVIVISGYCIKGLAEEGPKHEFYPINPTSSKVWDMIGFSFYSFEGIGTVMPIYENTKMTVNFKGLLIGALVTLSLIFTCFGLLCFRYFGPMPENKSFVIENLRQDDPFVNITKLLFCVNLVFSYPLTIYPTNKIWE